MGERGPQLISDNLAISQVPSAFLVLTQRDRFSDAAVVGLPQQHPQGRPPLPPLTIFFDFEENHVDRRLQKCCGNIELKDKLLWVQKLLRPMHMWDF